MSSFIETFEAYSGVIKLMANFTPENSDDLEYENDYVKIRLVRSVVDRMTFQITLKNENVGDIALAGINWFYPGSDSFQQTSLRLYKNGERSFVYSSYDEINFVNILDLQNRDEYRIDYPISGDQYFQRLTQFYMPTEDFLDKLMYIGADILNDHNRFSSFAFMPHPIEFEKFGTDLNNVVQYIIDAVKGLIQEEINRFKMQGY